MMINRLVGGDGEQKEVGEFNDLEKEVLNTQLKRFFSLINHGINVLIFHRQL